MRLIPPGRKALHLLDDISDTICHAADAARFCAAAHAEASWRSASLAACALLDAYIAKLNTESFLCDKLERTMEEADALTAEGRSEAGWTDEEQTVAASFLLEFRNAGIGYGEEVGRHYRRLIRREQGLSSQLALFEVCEF
jgi:Zn-dependent oligopeptidase